MSDDDIYRMLEAINNAIEVTEELRQVEPSIVDFDMLNSLYDLKDHFENKLS